MASVIKAGNATDGVQVTSDNTGILELKTGTGAGTTAVTIGTDQSVTFAGAISSSGNQTVTGNLTVNGNTTLGDANTDTILMTAAPSIGGAGLGMGFGFRNRIINGAMVIDQRNAGASVTPAAVAAFPVDRWGVVEDTDGAMTAQRSTLAPAGFTNSLLCTTTTADASLSASQYTTVRQFVEGFNVADLGWGSANAQTVTLSFWVRSSITGTFSGALGNSAYNRSYPFDYTISAANTWEYKTVLIPGDTSGTWLTDNGLGIRLYFSLGAGSDFNGTANTWNATGRTASTTGTASVIGTLNATWQITGVQLEKGSTATSFDYRDYGRELMLCQRYFEKSYDIGAIAGASTITGACKYVSPRTVNPSDDIFSVCYLVSKRSSPTVTVYSTTGASGNIRNISSATDVASGGVTSGENSYSVRWSITDGNFYGWQWISSAEL